MAKVLKTAAIIVGVAAAVFATGGALLGPGTAAAAAAGTAAPTIFGLSAATLGAIGSIAAATAATRVMAAPVRRRRA